MPPVVRAAVLVLTCWSLAAARDAAAQGTLEERILQVQEARELTSEAQATLAEGLKDASPRVRRLAVRAAGRFESPALLGQIVPLLSDADRNVRHGAAIAAADAAKVFPTQAIEALTAAMGGRLMRQRGK